MRPEESRAARVAPAEPWRSFLRELDELLTAPVELRCLGGFVVTQQYGIVSDQLTSLLLGAVGAAHQ